MWLDAVRESALKVDWAKNPLSNQGIEPVSAACQSDTLPTELHPHVTEKCILGVHFTVYWDDLYGVFNNLVLQVKSFVWWSPQRWGRMGFQTTRSLTHRTLAPTAQTSLSTSCTAKSTASRVTKGGRRLLDCEYCLHCALSPLTSFCCCCCYCDEVCFEDTSV